MHKTIAGDVLAAIKHGLTIKASCGLVFVPQSYGDECDEYPPCPECHPRGLRAWYVYRCYDDFDRLVYVGCSGTPKTRLDTHRGTSWWYPQVARVRCVVYRTRSKALAMESEAIATENPRWNIRGRDRAAFALDDFRDLYVAMRQNGQNESRLHKVAAEAALKCRTTVDDFIASAVAA